MTKKQFVFVAKSPSMKPFQILLQTSFNTKLLIFWKNKKTILGVDSPCFQLLVILEKQTIIGLSFSLIYLKSRYTNSHLLPANVREQNS